MPRKTTYTTLWTARDQLCNVRRTCPGVHDVGDRPDVHYVISREADAREVAAWVLAHGPLQPGHVLGAVPMHMDPTGYMVTTRATDPDDWAVLAQEIGPGEVLGTVPAGSWTRQEVTA
jgi:hypothetical protein